MNENKRKGFLWLDEWADLTVSFTDAQVGRLLRAVQAHSMGKTPKLGKDASVLVAFNFICGCVDRYNAKYDEICQKRAESGKRGRQKQLGQMPANADTCQQISPNAGYPNPNPNPNPNNKPIPLTGGGDTPAPASGFSPFEIFGKFQNVQLFADQYRTLCMTYGQDATDSTIEDLSAKLADGSKQSSNHYATLDYWLRIHQAGGYDVPMSSKDSDPEEARLRSVWESCTEQEQQQYRDHNQGKDPMQVYREGKEEKQ